MIPFESLAGAALAEAYCADLRRDPDGVQRHLLGVAQDPQLVGALLQLRNRRFLELIHREDRVEEWARFSEHEVQRTRGGPAVGWGDPALRRLAATLRSWSASDYSNDPAVLWVGRRAAEVGVTRLTKAGQSGLALGAFRTALWRAWRGGAE